MIAMGCSAPQVAPCCPRAHARSLASASAGAPLLLLRPRGPLLARRSTLRSLSAEPSLWEILCLENTRPRSSAGHYAFRIVNSGRRQVNSGSTREPENLRGGASGWDGAKALAVTEGVCIVVAAASYGTSACNRQQNSFVAASSSDGQRRSVFKIGDVSTWYVPALWAALVINAVLRFVQRKSWGRTSHKDWAQKSIRGFSLEQRVGKLEEDVHDVTTASRMLARHLEKLGVRFRTIKSTLRDPVQETVDLAEKTSEVVRTLAQREEILERELQKTQDVLVAMQGQQTRQLDLLVAGMSKTSRSQRALEERVLKEVSRTLGRMTGGSAEIGSSASAAKRVEKNSPKRRKQELVKDIGSFWSSWLANDNWSGNSRAAEEAVASNEEPRVQPIEEQRHADKENGHAAVVPNAEAEKGKKSAYLPDTSFTKEDFWAVSPTDAPSGCEPIAESERDGRLQYTSGQRPHSGHSSGKLDSFFSGRKGASVGQSDMSLRSSSRSGSRSDFDESGFHDIYSPPRDEPRSNGSSL